MNSKFRRDYLYTINTGRFKGITLRYLCYDRVHKRYVFVDGEHKHGAEVYIAIPKRSVNTVQRQTSKVKWIGYKETDQYKR